MRKYKSIRGGQRTSNSGTKTSKHVITIHDTSSIGSSSFSRHTTTSSSMHKRFLHKLLRGSESKKKKKKTEKQKQQEKQQQQQRPSSSHHNRSFSTSSGSSNDDPNQFDASFPVLAPESTKPASLSLVASYQQRLIELEEEEQQQQQRVHKHYEQEDTIVTHDYNYMLANNEDVVSSLEYDGDDDGDDGTNTSNTMILHHRITKSNNPVYDDNHAHYVVSNNQDGGGNGNDDKDKDDDDDDDDSVGLRILQLFESASKNEDDNVDGEGEDKDKEIRRSTIGDDEDTTQKPLWQTNLPPDTLILFIELEEKEQELITTKIDTFAQKTRSTLEQVLSYAEKIITRANYNSISHHIFDDDSLSSIDGDGSAVVFYNSGNSNEYCTATQGEKAEEDEIDDGARRSSNNSSGAASFNDDDYNFTPSFDDANFFDDNDKDEDEDEDFSPSKKKSKEKKNIPTTSPVGTTTATTPIFATTKTQEQESHWQDNFTPSFDDANFDDGDADGDEHIAWLACPSQNDDDQQLTNQEEDRQEQKTKQQQQQQYQSSLSSPSVIITTTSPAVTTTAKTTPSLTMKTQKQKAHQQDDHNNGKEDKDDAAQYYATTRCIPGITVVNDNGADVFLAASATPLTASSSNNKSGEATGEATPSGGCHTMFPSPTNLQSELTDSLRQIAHQINTLLFSSPSSPSSKPPSASASDNHHPIDTTATNHDNTAVNPPPPAAAAATTTTSTCFPHFSTENKNDINIMYRPCIATTTTNGTDEQEKKPLWDYNTYWNDVVTTAACNTNTTTMSSCGKNDYACGNNTGVVDDDNNNDIVAVQNTTTTADHHHPLNSSTITKQTDNTTRCGGGGDNSNDFGQVTSTCDGDGRNKDNGDNDLIEFSSDEDFFFDTEFVGRGTNCNDSSHSRSGRGSGARVVDDIDDSNFFTSKNHSSNDDVLTASFDDALYVYK